MATIVDKRPPFTTIIKGTSVFINDEKERRFQEWKRRNVERMKRANIRPKVYEFSRPPKPMIHESPKITTKSKPFFPQVKEALLFGHRSKGMLADKSKTRGKTKRKRFIKVRNRERSILTLKKLSNSSSEEDSGLSSLQISGSNSDSQLSRTSSKKSTTRSRSNGQESLIIKQLIKDTIQISISEVRREERHMMQLSRKCT